MQGQSDLRLEVITAVKTSIMALRAMTPCVYLADYQHFGEINRIDLQKTTIDNQCDVYFNKYLGQPVV
jgi:hypothetical protein